LIDDTDPIPCHQFPTTLMCGLPQDQQFQVEWQDKLMLLDRIWLKLQTGRWGGIEHTWMLCLLIKLPQLLQAPPRRVNILLHGPWLALPYKHLRGLGNSPRKGDVVELTIDSHLHTRHCIQWYIIYIYIWIMCTWSCTIFGGMR